MKKLVLSLLIMFVGVSQLEARLLRRRCVRCQGLAAVEPVPGHIPLIQRVFIPDDPKLPVELIQVWPGEQGLLP